MSPRLAKIATVTFLVFNCILWSQFRGRFAHGSSGVQPIQGLLAKRGEVTNLTSVECAPIQFPASEQCTHVREACPESETLLGLPPVETYFCTEPKLRPLVFIGLLAWLALLFTTLGIGASDFFCPNLATIATVLGLNENVAGVTFLAFGNGSPDVFSTFSAMRSNAGSLAIGELLGAASFIVSVVVGSMCIIKPFHVHRGPFLRDVGVFTIAVSILLWILHDGILQAWEAGMMVALYITYVTIVVIGTWWDKRQQKRRQANIIIRQEYVDDSPPSYDFEPYRDDPTPTPLSLDVPSHTRGRALSNPIPPRTPPELPRRPRSRSPPSTPITPRPSASLQHLPSFSLLSALEFRDVVTSLQTQSNALSLSAFDAAPLTSRLLRTPSTRSRTASLANSLANIRETEVNPFEEALHVHLNHLSPDSSLILDRSVEATPISPSGNGFPSSNIDESHHRLLPPTRWQRLQHAVYPITRVLFPHLHNFSHKSVASIFVGIFATPGVLALTITLPVVTTPQEEPVHLVSPVDERLVDFEEEGVERVLVAEDELKDEVNDGVYHRWLTALQCILGPLFCVAMIMGTDRNAKWYLVAAAIGGVSAAVLVLVFSNRGNNSAGRLVRCFMGFIIAIVWIMTIADEVVGVLQTFGLIFGLSDAIIGLTVFAIGNSLADLVANTSVAKFAPIMGFSACFGGPMMNILLGVGVSGSIVIEENGRPYNLHFSTTLLVSAIALLVVLLTTLVWIPYNGYFLSRKWGMFLIAFYSCIMAVTLIVEKNT